MAEIVYFRKLRHNFGTVDQEEPPARKGPIELPRQQPSPPPTQQYREPSPPPSQEAPAQPVVEAAPAPVPQAPAQQPHTRNLLAEGLPPRQPDSDEEQDDDDWGDDGKY